MVRSKGARRVALALAAALAAATVAVVGGARSSAASGPDLNNVSLLLAPVVAGIPSPLALTWRRGDDRMYVAERAGKVVIVDTTTRSVVGTVLTLNGVGTAGERGLLGLAFSDDGSKLYVDYADTAGTLHIVEYTMAGDV